MPKKEPEIIEATSSTDSNGEVVQLASNRSMTMKEFNQFLMQAKDVQDDPDLDPYARIIEQVLNAKTPDDVLTPVEAIKARDLIGHALIAEGFEFNESEFDVGSPMYASLHAIYIGILPPQELDLARIQIASPQQPIPEGTSVVVNCGHKKVIAQLVQLQRLNAFPRNVTFAERGRSKVSGETMLTLLKWGSTMEDQESPEQDPEAPPGMVRNR